MVGDTVLSVRTTASAFVNSYPGVCGRRREGQTRVRAGGQPRLPPVPTVSLPPRPPPAPATHGEPCQEPEDGRRTRRRSRWTAREDDAAAQLFATNILQLLTLNFERSRNIVVKISQENQSPENAIRLMP